MTIRVVDDVKDGADGSPASAGNVGSASDELDEDDELHTNIGAAPFLPATPRRSGMIQSAARAPVPAGATQEVLADGSLRCCTKCSMEILRFPFLICWKGGYEDACGDCKKKNRGNKCEPVRVLPPSVLVYI